LRETTARYFQKGDNIFFILSHPKSLIEHLEKFLTNTEELYPSIEKRWKLYARVHGSYHTTGSNCSTNKLLREEDTILITEPRRHVPQSIINITQHRDFWPIRFHLTSTEGRLLEEIYTSATWPIVTSFTSHFEYNAHFHGYVFVVTNTGGQFKTALALLRIVGEFGHVGAFQHRLRVLAVVAGEPGSSDVARHILAALRRAGIYDAVVLVRGAQPHIVNAFTWRPYQPPSGNCGRLEQAVVLDTWVDSTQTRHFLRNSSFQENKIPQLFEGCALNVFAYSNPPYVLDVEGRPSDGSEIRVLRDTAQRMNMSLKVSSRYTDVSLVVSNVLPPLRVRSSHAYPHFVHQYRWYVPLAEPYPRWVSISRLCRTETWLCGVLSLVLAAVTLRSLAVLSHRHTAEDSCRYSSALQCLLTSWSALLAVAVGRVPRAYPIRTFFLSWVMFSLALNTVFQAFVTTYLIDVGRKHQINSYKELLKENFSFSFDSMDMLERHISYSKKPGFYATKTFDSLMLAIQRPNTAVMLTDELFTYNYGRICNFNHSVKFHKIADEAVPVYVSFKEGSKVPYLDRISDIIRRMVQAGIPDKIMRDITDPKGLNLGTREVADLRAEYVPLSLTHLLSPFTVLLLGLCISGVTFAAELFVRSASSRHHHHHQVKGAWVHSGE
jgi:hypothetical protein